MMEKTRYEGVLYKINRRKRRVYYARFKVRGRAYLRKIGEEPDVNARLASQLRYEMIDDVRGGDRSGRLVDDVFGKYIRLREPMLSDSWSYNMRKTYERHLKDVIGHLPVEEVRSQDIQLRMNEMLERGYAVSTVKQLKDCVSGMYRHMLPELDNVGKLLKLPKFDNKIYFSITDEEARRLYDVIVGYEWEQWRVYFSFLLHGRRRWEIVTLTWDRVDIERGVYVIDADKNKTGKRISAPMLPFLVEMLEGYGGDRVGYVVKGRYGNHVSKSGIDYHWTRIKERAGLPKMRLHDLRHMIGFLAANNGFTLEEIGYVLGHDSTLTTKRYANMDMKTAKRTLEAVHEIMRR
jgi:integrase